MIIGAAQIRLSPDADQNLGTIERYMAEAARQGVDILNFPETSLTGYIHEGFLKITPQEIDQRLNQVKKMVRKSGVSIVLGTPFWENNQLFNSVIVLLRDGREYVYHKINLVSYETDYFAAGHQTLTFKLDEVTFGTIVCRDQNFPELAKRYKQEGVQVLFISCAHFYPPSEARLKVEKNRALPIARASENQLFVCKANSIGTFRGQINLGHSIIVGPNGCVLCEAGETSEELLAYDINLAMDWSWKNPIRNA